ncbi:MAG: acyl carrier protein [Oscillospiraceae bacterium]
MNNAEICEKIKGMLVENLRIPADELENDSELFGDDIGLDSIDSIEIIAGIDNLFGVQMTGAAKEHFQSINTLAKYVEEHLNA